MVNEQISKESCNFAVRTTKVSVQLLWKALKAYSNHRKIKVAKKNDKVTGKQTVKELIGQGQGVNSIDLVKNDLREFEKITKKYGVDFAIVKDKNQDPPVYTIFFKAKDQDAIENVLRAYTAKRMKKQTREKPSILQKLKKFKEVVANMPRKVHEKRKEKEL